MNSENTWSLVNLFHAGNHTSNRISITSIPIVFWTIILPEIGTYVSVNSPSTEHANTKTLRQTFNLKANN